MTRESNGTLENTSFIHERRRKQRKENNIEKGAKIMQWREDVISTNGVGTIG